MGFLNKLKYKAEDRVADKIVDKMFGKKQKEAEVEATVAEQQVAAAQAEAAAQPETRTLTPEEQRAIANAQAASMSAAQDAMGMAYNTKRCPECQAICFNAPVTCPYCGADLKSVKPLTPKELEELE